MEPTERVREYWASVPNGKELEVDYYANPGPFQKIVCLLMECTPEELKRILEYLKARG